MPRASRRFTALLAMVVLLIAAAGYLVKGTPDYAARLAQASAPAAQAAAGSASMPSAEELEQMIGKLAAHLQSKPDDGEGWTMLGRARAMQGRLDEAVAAYARAVALRGDDARLLIDYAELLGLKNNRSLAGEPTTLLERALRIDPDQPKALALAGAAAYDARQYALAVRHWERLAAVSDPQASYLPQVKESIAEARKLGGLPAANDAVAAQQAVPGAAPAAAAAPAATASLSGTVSLAGALAGQTQPEHTLFIFARAAQGPRMPIAVLRKQVRDLPLSFTLDDTMAMSPALTLSKAGEVIVVARISRSGQAAAQPGDLFGESAAVKPGARDLKLVIDQTVKQQQQP